MKGYGLRVTARGAKSFIVSGRVRGRIVDYLLIAAAIIAALWLAALLYHNYFGGHVERAEAPGQASRARMTPVFPDRFV